MDTSRFPSQNRVGVAGVVRDHRGASVSRSHGFNSLVVESDASNVVSCIKNKCITSSNGSFVGEILELFNSAGGGSCQFVLH